VPAERHEHYDPDGNLTGFTVVIRESAWLDSDVAQLLEVAQVEAESCPGCGWHESFTDDPDTPFAATATFCQVCAGEAQYRRHLAAEDARFDESAAQPLTPRPADGRRVRMTITPTDAERGGPGGDTH